MKRIFFCVRCNANSLVLRRSRCPSPAGCCSGWTPRCLCERLTPTPTLTMLACGSGSNEWRCSPTRSSPRSRPTNTSVRNRESGGGREGGREEGRSSLCDAMRKETIGIDGVGLARCIGVGVDLARFAGPESTWFDLPVSESTRLDLSVSESTRLDSLVPESTRLDSSNSQPPHPTAWIECPCSSPFLVRQACLTAFCRPPGRAPRRSLA